MWNKTKRLMQDTDISRQDRYSRLVNEFDKFVAMDGESLKSVYERFCTLINVMDRNNVTPKEISINTKLLNSLQPEYSKYVTLACQKNQPVIQDGRVNIQSKNVGYAGNGNRNTRIPRTESTPRKKNMHCYNCNGRGHYAHDCPKPRVRDVKYFREKMFLAAKDEARVHLDEEENNFMLVNAYGDDTLEELNASVIMMTHIQPTNDKSDVEPTYDSELISEVNASQIDMINRLFSKSDHEHRNHDKLKTIIHTSVGDQIDSDIILMILMWIIIVDKLNMIQMLMIDLFLILNLDT
nr:hypothetical protein [Tanacetum cinerariifolium]